MIINFVLIKYNTKFETNRNTAKHCDKDNEKQIIIEIDKTSILLIILIFIKK